MTDVLTQLKRPFDPSLVKWRVGATTADKSKGIALAYIDARDVMKRLDEVCGVSGWQKRLTPFQNGFVCEIDVWDHEKKMWTTRSDVAGLTKVEPEKGGASDAFKRAGANWGIGRYLYYLPNEWVALKNVGSEKYPKHVLGQTPKLPKWATPEGYDEKVVEAQADASSGMDAEEMYTVSDIDTSEDRLKAIANAARN
jgi:hypothetical protein